MEEGFPDRLVLNGDWIQGWDGSGYKAAGFNDPTMPLFLTLGHKAVARWYVRTLHVQNNCIVARSILGTMIVKMTA